MISAVFLATAALTLTGATYRAVGLWHEPSRPAWAFTVTLYALGVALVLRAPVIAQQIDTTVRVPSLNVLVGNSLTLISACCVLTVLVYFTDPTGYRSRRKTRLWIIFLVVALAAMTVLFSWSFSSYPDGLLERRSPQYVAYISIYAIYLTTGMIEVSRLSLRHAKHATDRYLRIGLRMIGIGSALGILYCLILIYKVVASHTHRFLNLGPTIVTSAVLPAACCALLVIGSTIGGWGPWFSELWDRLEDYRSYRRLGPLWRALVDVAPDVIPPQDMASLTIGQKRYRRIIEIRDLILTLRAYRDPTIATVATNAALPGSSLAKMAAAEAAVLASAIRARRSGQRPSGSPDSVTPPQLGADLMTESRWLEAVSAALPRALAAPAQRPAAMTTKDG